MAWFNPTPLEISIVEQIETARFDETLDGKTRTHLVAYYWEQLERAHGSRVSSLMSPEGKVIDRPGFLSNK